GATRPQSSRPAGRCGGLRAARQHHLAIAERDESRGISDGVRSARACGDDRVVRPPQAVRYRDVSGCEVDQAARNEERRHPPRPSLLERDRRLGNAGKPADSRADHYARLDLIVVAGWLPARVIERLARGAQGEDDEIVDLALLL